MGVYTFTIVDQTCPVAPARLFKALILENHDILPKVAPHVIKSIDFVEGDSTVVGCIKQTTFVDGNYFKSKLDELDVDNLTFKYTSFEGNIDLGATVEFVVYEGQVKASGTGSDYKSICHFHTKGDVALTEEDVMRRLQGGLKAFETVVEYLVNNPQACT